MNPDDIEFLKRLRGNMQDEIDDSVEQGDPVDRDLIALSALDHLLLTLQYAYDPDNA